MGFQRIQNAAKSIKAPPYCFYPQSSNWREVHVDEELTNIRNRVNSLFRGKIALLGPHGCGKTFFLLYLGFWWEAIEQPKYLSFYAQNPSMLSLEAVCSQWDQKPLYDRPCLWIIDDIHNDHEGILSDVVELFEDIAPRGWWLILAGWALPAALQDKRLDEDPIECIEWKLTPQTIAFALRALHHSEFAEDRDLINKLVARGVGLMQILWAATDRPDILRTRNFEELERACEARIQACFLPKAPEQRAILARLKFLGLPFVVRNPEESALLQSGWGVQQVGHPLTGYELSSDAIAQILLKAEVSGAGTQEELMNSFLKPLRPYIRDLLQQGVLTLPGKVFQSLRSSSSVEWLGGKLTGDGERLIKEFLNEELLEVVRSAVIKLLKKGEVRCSDLFDAARMIVTIEPYARTWAQETAKAILQASGRDQLLALFRSEITPRDRLCLWRSLAALARLGEDSELKEAVVQAIEDKSLQDAFLQEIGSERGKILKEAKRIDKHVYWVLLEAHCKSLAVEIRKVPPRGVWSRLRTLTKWEPPKAVEIPESLGLDSISSLIFAAPHAARAFLAEFKGKEERGQLKNLFHKAIQHRRIAKEDVQQWTSARDLGSFVYLSRSPEYIDVDVLFPYADRVAQEASPALIADVCREVAKYAQTSRLRKYLAKRILESIQQEKDPLIERLGALERLNSRLLTPELLEGATRRWRELEPKRLFQLLYLLLAVRRLAGLGERLAREIVNDWQLILAAQHPLDATALAGLCLFVLGDEAAEFSLPLNQLPEPSPETKPPMSPLETVCQILALAKKVPEPGTPGYTNLEWLIEQVMRPSTHYLRNWHRLTAPRRRLSLAILFAGLRELQERGEREFTQLASQLASSIGDPCQDDIWDNDIIARLEAVRMGVGHQAALNLLKRCCNRWGKIIQKKILRSQADKVPSQEAIEAALQILRHAVALVAGGKDDVAKACARSLLDAAASQMPGERQEEIKDLQNQLVLSSDDTLPTTPSAATSVSPVPPSETPHSHPQDPSIPEGQSIEAR